MKKNPRTGQQKKLSRETGLTTLDNPMGYPVGRFEARMAWLFLVGISWPFLHAPCKMGH
jgi:hypothetical protein